MAVGVPFQINLTWQKTLILFYFFVLESKNCQRKSTCQIFNFFLTPAMTLRSERILVTGGSGFLGQHIVKLLQERTDYVKEIRVLDLKPFTKQLGLL